MIWIPHDADPAYEAGREFEDKSDTMRRRIAFWQGVKWQRAQELACFTVARQDITFEPEDRT